ncbi:MAG: cyclic nucleotide-binding domain-containing protein [Deltaproteobacteria bacterium]|nr:cyclic nucleotide-binding domain-containing protein [Deltaproteobacteria bacterium]
MVANRVSTNTDFSGPHRPASDGTSDGAPLGAFGRYELVKLLAVGGMAEVFLARSKAGGIDRACVIKRILPRFSTNREFVSMFIDEARITIGLDHENIVRLFDFGQVDGAYYMALEYVDGVDLVDVLRARKARGEAVPPAAAAYVAREVLRGLEHAHALRDHRGRPMGIVHRDVSPQNILISWTGAVKVSDFGIADARNRLTSTMHGQVKGKFSYMSPEQASAKPLDGRSDVWAVGVVLWEMLVGGRLFSADGPVETMARVMEAPIPAASEKRDGVPAELDRVVLQALDRRLNKRWAGAAAMAAGLDRFLATHPFGKAEMADLLASLELDKVTTETRQRGGGGGPGNDVATVALPADLELRRLAIELKKERNLWTLVDIGKRHGELGDAGAARAHVRAAAAIFAHRGMLVPAICALHALRELDAAAALEADLRELASLRVHDRGALVALIERWHAREQFDAVRDLEPQGLGADVTAEGTLISHPAPLFGRVTTSDFVRLGMLAVVERHGEGEVLVAEGEQGSALYAIGRGRVLVSARPTEDGSTPARTDRVYVAALAEGDFFGEFSLLTRRPRSATVEAQTDVVLLRLDRDGLDGLLLGDASFREPLVEFYKERVCELLLAKNALMAALTPEARRRLLDAAQVHRYRDEESIVKEGEKAGDVFFIMSGEVEVLRDVDGFPVFLDKLRDGQFFGEMAALQGGTRTASVRAIGDVELLGIAGDAMAKVLGQAPEVLALFEQAMNERASETVKRLEETARIFTGV